MIQHGNQDAARLQQGKRGLERGDAGFGLGGDVVVAARQVAHVENGGGDGLLDVPGEVLVSRVDKLHALDELVLLQAVGGGGEGAVLNVKRVDFACAADKLGEQQGVVSVACCAVEYGVACVDVLAQ